MTDEQAVMHYNRHHLTTSVTHMTTLTYASTSPAYPLVSSSKTKPCQLS